MLGEHEKLNCPRLVLIALRYEGQFLTQLPAPKVLLSMGSSQNPNPFWLGLFRAHYFFLFTLMVCFKQLSLHCRALSQLYSLLFILNSVNNITGCTYSYIFILNLTKTILLMGTPQRLKSTVMASDGIQINDIGFDRVEFKYLDVLMDQTYLGKITQGR